MLINLKIYQKLGKYLNALELVWKGGLIDIKRINQLKDIVETSTYKITNEQVKYALTLLKQNEQITMFELAKLVKQKYNNFDITPQHLGQVIRDKNRTRHRISKNYKSDK